MRNFLSSAALAAALTFVGNGALAADEAQIKRGEYLFHAGGCESCHTDKKAATPRLAGGPAIKTAFGTFYGPNVTPNKERGIGVWSEADFIRAMRDGRTPSGAHLFPVFPYTSYTNITDTDLKDMWAYLQTVPSSDRESKRHDVSFPFSWRFLQAGWRMLEFRPGPFKPDPTKSAEVNRGAYLVTALTHCGECHTPRNALGGLEYDKWLAGNSDGPDGGKIPNVTGLKWSAEEIAEYLSTGLTPDGDSAGGLMAEVIENSTGKLTDEDRKAIAAYLKSIPAIPGAAKPN
jgi:mono/diheme cytochrome c family protein